MSIPEREDGETRVCVCGHPEPHHIKPSLGSIVGGVHGCVSCDFRCEIFTPNAASKPDGETRSEQYPPISDAECQAFERHANEGATIDIAGEGVGYSPIQPYDLVRFCRTVAALRVAADRASRALALMIHPGNGYCNQCGGHWLYRLDGSWKYDEGEHQATCIGRGLNLPEVSTQGGPHG